MNKLLLLLCIAYSIWSSGLQGNSYVSIKTQENIILVTGQQIAKKYNLLEEYKRKHLATRTIWNRVAGLGLLLCSASYFDQSYQGVMPMVTYPMGLVCCCLCSSHCENNSGGIGSFFYDWATEWNYVYQKKLKQLNKFYKRE